MRTGATRGWAHGGGQCGLDTVWAAWLAAVGRSAAVDWVRAGGGWRRRRGPPRCHGRRAPQPQRSSSSACCCSWGVLPVTRDTTLWLPMGLRALALARPFARPLDAPPLLTRPPADRRRPQGRHAQAQRRAAGRQPGHLLLQGAWGPRCTALPLPQRRARPRGGKWSATTCGALPVAPVSAQKNNITFTPPDRLLSYLPLAHIFDRCARCRAGLCGPPLPLSRRRHAVTAPPPLPSLAA